MATQSFSESLKLESVEEIKLIADMIDEADASGSSPPTLDTLKSIERGNRLIEEGFFDRA